VGERVLLIEDDSRLADMVGEYLGKAGFHVIHAENGTRGLALHGREPVDVVILDLMLPDIEGLDICRQTTAAPARCGLAARRVRSHIPLPYLIWIKPEHCELVACWNDKPRDYKWRGRS
jgi:CheY-like chemotaxis protein